MRGADLFRVKEGVGNNNEEKVAHDVARRQEAPDEGEHGDRRRQLRLVLGLLLDLARHGIPKRGLSITYIPRQTVTCVLHVAAPINDIDYM